MNIAVILAAGSSKRMKGLDKVFFKIKGKPLFFYTLLAFEKHPQIDKIIFVSKKDKFKKITAIIRDFKLKKIAELAEGGKKWQDSAYMGLDAAQKIGAKAGDLILFHNAANPLVSKEEISNVLAAAREHGAALLCQPAKDTTKEVALNGFIVKTLDRKTIFLAQVPQVIEYDLAKRAFQKAKEDNFYGTDGVSLVERLGQKVKVIVCSYKNIKVTTRDDLKIVGAFLKN